VSLSSGVARILSVRTRLSTTDGPVVITLLSETADA
jgi:hypothetical protein